MTRIYTIGHGRKELPVFVAQLRAAGVVRVVDIRLRPVSRFCPWARKPALEKILPQKYHLEYVHDLRMAATDELLDGLKKYKMPWATYARRFLALMRKRKIEEELTPDLFDVPTALMCSETSPSTGGGASAASMAGCGDHPPVKIFGDAQIRASVRQTPAGPRR